MRISISLALVVGFLGCADPPAASHLVRIDAEAKGANCEHGGVALSEGRDRDKDGELDADEVVHTEYVCSGPSDLHCDDGGLKREGIVSVGTQAELDELATLHCIEGDLIISGLDAATIPPSELVMVTGSVVIAGNPQLTSLDGLDNLEIVGRNYALQANEALVDISALAGVDVGMIMVVGNASLVDFSGMESVTKLPHFYVTNNPALESFHGLENVLTAEQVTIRANPQLISLSALGELLSTQQLEISGNSQLATVAFPKLQKNDFALKVNSNPVLTTISFPSLATSNGLEVMSNGALASVEAPSLLLTNVLFVNSNPLLTTVTAPKLKFVTANVMLIYSPLLDTLNFSELTAIGGQLGLMFTPKLTSLTGFSGVTSIAGDFVVQGANALVNFTGLDNLSTVSGNMSVLDNTQLTSFVGLDGMTTIEGNLTITGNTSMQRATAEAFANQVTVNGSVTLQ